MRPVHAGRCHSKGRPKGTPPSSRRRACQPWTVRPADLDFDLAAAARALSAVTPGAWISHVTAARLRCLCLPPRLSDSTQLHLSKLRSLPSVRRKGVIGHSVIAASDEVESVDGIRISTRPRTWLDLARLLPLNDLICLGDELIRVPRPGFEGRDDPFATLAGLREMTDPTRTCKESSTPAQPWNS